MSARNQAQPAKIPNTEAARSLPPSTPTRHARQDPVYLRPFEPKARTLPSYLMLLYTFATEMRVFLNEN